MLNPNPYTLNPEPYSLNNKQETLNPKAQDPQQAWRSDAAAVLKVLAAVVEVAATCCALAPTGYWDVQGSGLRADTNCIGFRSVRLWGEFWATFDGVSVVAFAL